MVGCCSNYHTRPQCHLLRTCWQITPSEENAKRDLKPCKQSTAARACHTKWIRVIGPQVVRLPPVKKRRTRKCDDLTMMTITKLEKRAHFGRILWGFTRRCYIKCHCILGVQRVELRHRSHVTSFPIASDSSVGFLHQQRHISTLTWR